MRLRGGVLAVVMFIAVSAASAQTVNPQDYEVVLVPLAVDVASGAFGTIWQTMFSVYHDGTVPNVIGYNTMGDPLILPSRHTYSPRLYTSEPGEPPGTLVYVGRSSAADTHFDLRFWNAAIPSARAALPVIPEDRLLRGRAVLLRVPGGSGLRRMLRIYAPLSEAAVVVRVSVADELLGNEIGAEYVTLQTSQKVEIVAGVPFRLHPTAAQVSLDADFPTIAGYQSVDVVVEPLIADTAFWAFVAATSNTTQEVTLMLPN